MRVHLLTVPNTQPTAAFPLDGFCVRGRLFAELLRDLGHEVLLYGVEQTDVAGVTFVSVMTDAERAGFIGPVEYQTVSFDPGCPLFLTYNVRAAHEILIRKQPGDVIATIAGSAQHLVSEHHPELPFVEYSIGYRGVCAPYRVYESHVWRHTVSGYTGVDTGRPFDAVIYPWFPMDPALVTDRPEPYVLYVGRCVPLKGITVACEVAKRAGVKLLVTGFGDLSLITTGEYVGAVDMPTRDRLLAQATAVLMPTRYLEPFGNVAAEAQLYGTPVIASDFGAMVETVRHGETGFHCATLGDFVQAVHLAPSLDRARIRQWAQAQFSAPVAARQYTAFFDRLAHRAEGFETHHSTLQESACPSLTISPPSKSRNSNGRLRRPTVAVPRFAPAAMPTLGSSTI